MVFTLETGGFIVISLKLEGLNCVDPDTHILSMQPKYLNANYELWRGNSLDK